MILTYAGQNNDFEVVPYKRMFLPLGVRRTRGSCICIFHLVDIIAVTERVISDHVMLFIGGRENCTASSH